MALWQAYIERRGSLNVGRRVEAGAALQGFMTNRAAGGKVKMLDLMPYERPRTPEKPQGSAAFDALARRARQEKEAGPRMHPDDERMLRAFEA